MNPDILVDVREGGLLPSRGSAMAAGMDLKSPEPYHVSPGNRALIDLKLKMVIPDGYFGWIAPRSGLAAKNGIQVMGGVVDSDYRGSIKVVLYNSGREPFQINAGDRIAQMIIIPILLPRIREVTDVGTTERGEGGFGSTGK